MGVCVSPAVRSINRVRPAADGCETRLPKYERERERERTARREESVREEGFGSDAGELTPGSLGCCRLEKMEGDTLKPPLCRVFYKTTPLLPSLAAMNLTCFTKEHMKKKKKKKKKKVWFYEKL